MDELDKYILARIEHLLGRKGASTVTFAKVYELKKIRIEIQQSELKKQSPYILQKWLRDIHNIEMFTKVFYSSLEHKKTYTCDIIHIPDGRTARSPRLDSYEEALEYALNEGLKMIEEINNLKNKSI